MKFQNKKVLIVDKMHESIFPMLEEIGFQADYRPEVSADEIYGLIGSYELLFVRSKISVDDRLLNQAPLLKLVGRAGAGIDQVDVQALKARGIVLINAPEGNRDAVAEHAVGMLLCLFNKILLADSQVRSGIWDREGNRGLEISGKTIGIIGYGFMGQAFARRLQGFDCRVLAYDKFREQYGDEFAKESSLEEIRQEADVLSLHIPLTTENRSLINQEYLNGFRKSIYLINTARGELLPLKDLRLLLENGKIAGAVLDVLENEKLHQFSQEQEENFNYLVNSSKVVFTPHVAGWTHESYVKINRTLVEKLKKLL